MPTTIVRSRQSGAITVIDVSGRLTLGQSISDMRHALEGALIPETGDVIVNLVEVEYIDSAGIGALIAGLKQSQQNQCSFRLANVPKRVTDLLRLAGTWSLFRIAETVPPAE